MFGMTRYRTVTLSIWIVCQVTLINITVAQTCNHKGGSLQEEQRTDYTFGGLFIDHKYPIPCNGRVNKWHFCYYPPSSGSQFSTYSFSLGVYYSAVVIVLTRHVLRDSSILQVDISNQDIGSQYTCLSVDQEFDVQEGDYVGMYIEADRQNGYTKVEDALDIVGTTGTSSEYVQWERTFCQAIYQPDSVPLSCFDNITGYSLHAYVEYEPGLQVTTTVSPPLTIASTTTEDVISELTTNTATTESTFHSETTISQTFVSNSTTIQTTTQPVTDLDDGGNNEEASNNGSSALTNMELIIIVTLTCLTIAFGIGLAVMIGAAVIRYKRRQRIIKRNHKRREHHHIGLNHFVMVSDEQHSSQSSSLPMAYEVPQSTIKKAPDLQISGTSSENNFSNRYEGVVHINPTSLKGDSNINAALNGTENDEDQYELLVNCRIGTNRSFDTSSSDEGHTDNETMMKENISDPGVYNVTRQVNRQIASIKTAKSSIDENFRSEYAVLCNHYYKTLESVTSENTEDEDETEMFEEPANNEEELYAQVNKQRLKEILPKEIKIEAHLGSGQFGRVSQGTWNSYSHGPVKVAIKSLLSSRMKQAKIYRVKLLQEAAIMGQFVHPNVIQLLGVVDKKDMLMVVMELAVKGDLEKLLVSMVPDPGELVQPKTSKILLGYCQQVAFGMHYLASKSFVHRDIAARNILVTEDNILKIADFGMSRELANRDYYVSQGGNIPVKWTAPEAINFKKYSTASDVWSYGCLLYEIWSLGQKPFRDYSNSEAVEKIESGYRLPPPPGCPILIYELMIDCWHPKWYSRPLFKELILDLLAPDAAVLHIPPKEADTQKLATVLGGPLEAGEAMYTDLQRKYIEQKSQEE